MGAKSNYCCLINIINVNMLSQTANLLVVCFCLLIIKPNRPLYASNDRFGIKYEDSYRSDRECWR